MSQSTWDIIISTVFQNVQGIEDALRAAFNNHAGTSRPGYLEAGGTWYDSSSGILYLYDGSSDTALGSGDIGEVKSFAMALPSGWLALDGSAVSRTTYALLFAAIGTTFGVGDGSTTFNLPDSLGRGLIDSGSGSGLTARTLADSSGAETHQLTVGELAAHTHTQAATTDTSNTPPYYPSIGSRGTTPSLPTGLTASTGSDTAHNNMQPYLVLNFGIFTGV